MVDELIVLLKKINIISVLLTINIIMFIAGWIICVMGAFGFWRNINLKVDIWVFFCTVPTIMINMIIIHILLYIKEKRINNLILAKK